MPLLPPPRPSVRRALARAASALALLALTAGAASAQPTVTLTTDATTISENGGVATITATLSETSSTDVTVGLAFNRGSLEDGDVSLSGGLDLVIPAGELTASQTATARQDADLQDETFSLSIDPAFTTGATPTSPSSVTITINDDDDATTVTLAAAPTPIGEDGGTSTITATLGEETNADVTVTLSTDGDDDGSSLGSTTITIPRGQTTGTTTLTASSDDDEADETVTVSIDGVSGGNVTVGSPSSAAVVITDDDTGAGPTNPTVTLSVDDDSIDEAGGVATVTATLSQATNADVEVELNPSDSSIEAGDVTFAPNDLTITIPQGQTTGTLTATANPDADTDDESFTLTIGSVTGGGATAGSADQSVTVTINDDDATANPTVTLSVSGGGNVEEGESVTITATLSGGATADGDVTVTLAYEGGEGEFTAPTALVITDGQNSGAVTFSATDDTDDEENETVTVSIASVAGNATEDGDQSVTVTVIDNDGAGGGGGGGGGPIGDQVAVSFADSTASRNENAGTYEIQVQLSNALSSPASVTVTLVDGDSTDVGGFRSRTVTIPAGSSSATVSIPITSDAVAEGDETFTFQLSTTDSRLTVDRGTTTLTISDGGTGAAGDVTITEYDSIVGDDDDPFVELQADGTASLDDLSLVYLAADSTVIEVDDLGDLEADEDGFLVVSDDSDDSDDGARVANLVPDSFFGVAVVRGTPPAVGTTFDFAGDNVVDVLFVDEAAAAQARGLAPEDGSIQRRADGRPAFVAPPTPGAANQDGVPVANEPDGPAAELVSNVFPNPSAGRAALELTVASAQAVRVSVYDALGRQVAVAYDGEARPGAAVRVSLDGSGLAPGVYIVRVAGETFAQSRRLTVTR